MRPPVRTVCIACLHSLEISSGDDDASRAVCPHCGQVAEIDRNRADTSTTGDDFSPPPDPDARTPRVGIPVRPQAGTIGRFILREPLGEGGYGEVYRAFDPHLEREVALKVLKPNRLGEKALERFYREARAAARLDHPNIVGLHDAGRDEGRCWIAYQLVTGQTLSMLRDLERPTIDASVRIIRDLALALEHAHGRGVFHRDLKPANILIDETGRPRLTDFGLARRQDLESDLTQEGTILGTPQYMSPEAAAGRAHSADGRSDVYSLGVILYELICGRRPADVPSNIPLWRSTRIMTPPTPRTVDRAIPPELDRVCMKALAFDPEARYPNARAFADALSRYLANRLEREPARSSKPMMARLASGKGNLATGLVAAVSVVCLSLGMSLHFVTQPTPQQPKTSTRLPLANQRPPDRANPPTAPISATPEPPKAPVRPVAIKSSTSRIYHLSGCPNIDQILPKNLREIDYPDDEAVRTQRLKPCDHCRPTIDQAIERASRAG